MKKLECHSSTSYDEIINFILENKGSLVDFHYEIKGYVDWGNDDVKKCIINDDFLNWLYDYMGSKKEYRDNSAYVHNIKIY